MNEPGTRAGRRRQERRSPFRSSLVIEPFWRRALLAAVAVGVYAAAFTPLYARGGVGVTALSIFPVVILGWLFGSWGGLLSGVLVVPLNAMLLGFVGEPGWQIVVGAGGAEGSGLVIVVGSVIGLLRDLGVRLDRHLTDWRRAERALRETEDRYRLLFERSRDPIYVSRADGRIVETNDALLRLFGYTKSELLDVDFMTLYEDPEDRVRFAREIKRAGFVEDFPVRLLTKDDGARDCLISAVARYGSEDEIAEYQGTVHDVSESHSLHELAERRTRQLQDVVAELEAFTYSVSHDLRTHLVTMGGFSSILWSDHKERLDEKGQDFLRRIVEAGHRMDLFVQDLLGYSQVTRTAVKLEVVDLDELVQEALQALERPIKERGANVHVEGELPSARADRTLLGSAIENLISNGVKFVPVDRTPDVRISARKDADTVRIEVRDNGIGLAAEDVERIFRPFERLHPGLFQGTGVGLSIVNKAMERMGGDAGVDSEVGEGSTFWLVLRGT